MAEKTTAVIVDIDGTIADLSHRLHLIGTGKPDWEAFYSLAEEDHPMLDNIKMITDFVYAGTSGRMDILFVTGRPERIRDTTSRWIARHATSLQGKLFMRADYDHRPDDEVKKDIHDVLLKPRHDIVRVYDDRPRVVRMWKSLGYDVVDVGDGKEF